MEAGCGVHTCNIARRRLSQEDLEFEARAGYIRSSRPNPAAQRVAHSEKGSCSRMEIYEKWAYKTKHNAVTSYARLFPFHPSTCEMTGMGKIAMKPVDGALIPGII